MAIVCGSEEIMRRAEGVNRITGGYVSLTGTFSGNPISCRVALAVLKELRREGAYAALFDKGRRLMAALQRILDAAGIPAQVIGEPAAFQPWFTAEEIFDFRSAQTADPAMGFRFAQLLLDRGILKAHEKFFVSMAHSDEDIDRTIEAFEDAVAELATLQTGRTR